jgi:uncharacterized Zn finger protein (UPF0148 family)
MTELCPYCGTPLKETTWKRKFCPNCGIIDEPEEQDKKETPDYIG